MGKKNIKYESIIAGMMLKFNSIDIVDFSLLIEKFKKETNIDVIGYWGISQNGLPRYMKEIRNGDIRFKDNVSLDQKLEKEKCTLREKLKMIAGEEVVEFFEKLDLEKYYQDKAKKLSNHKNMLLNSANVLLISDDNEDEEELRKYGFKNVDCFKSIIRANNYFLKHPDELYKYHIIIKGNQNVQDCCFYGDVELDNTISRINKDNCIITPKINKYTYDKETTFSCLYLFDSIHGRSCNMEEHTYKAAYDRIVENAFINHVLDQNKMTFNLFKPIKDYINPNRLPLPTKKSKIRILYLDSIRVNEYAEEIANKLGLNITFIEDGNFTLGRDVKNHLGDYDIIIGSKSYSRNLIKMNNESTEQCKDTGRDLTLLVTYEYDTISQFDEDHIHDMNGIGSRIRLNYTYGGNYAIDSDLHKKDFKILRKNYNIIRTGENLGKYTENEIACIRGIVCASVHAYNEALLKNCKLAINDLDLKSVDTFNKEYNLVDMIEEHRKKVALAPINTFDKTTSIVFHYLNYYKDGLINQTPKGLIISEKGNSVVVNNIEQGNTISTISFSKEVTTNNLRIINIQTLSENGDLNPQETIGLYTRKYEGKDGIPNRPSKNQEKELKAIYDKIELELNPLIDLAWQKEYELEKNKSFIKTIFK